MKASLRMITIVVILSMFLVGCGTTPQNAPTAANAKVSLTFWYWAESDAPGADAWMAETVAAYKQIKPNVTINIVPQSTETLISAFQSAVTAKSGPDMASEWATGPVLGFVWQNAVAPISDYVPAAETANWLNTNENMYNGKLWAAPMYLIGIGVMYNKPMFAKAGVTPPASGRWTWDEFMAACAKIKAAGMVPWVEGDKDGYGGAWWFANLGIQSLDSTDDLRQAVIGAKSFTDPHYTGWYKTLDDMVKKGYFNQDTASMDLSQGAQAFAQGKGAMSFGTDGMIKQALTDLGANNVGVMRTPKLGTGKLADVGNATQSTGFFVTKWSKNPQAAADFLAFMHTPDRLAAWYKHTGVIAADKRFDRTLVTDPILQQMMTWETTGQQVWLENYLPGQVDSDADLTAGQMIFAQSGSPSDVSTLWERSTATWRNQHPDELTNWKNWQQ
jgi:raffinose/stachyose/melibiose transport system substrate-binding protein